MTASFFEQIWPLAPNSIHAVVGMKDGRTLHRWSDNCEWLANEALRLDQAGHETYFALAAFKEIGGEWNGRTHDNVQSVRAFWLDIDAGAAKYAKHGDKVYPSQDDAIDALGRFTKQFLKPTYVVSSGTGLHVYWVMTEDIAPAQWRALAKQFQAVCEATGFRADAARTSDQASILRVPGTLHRGSGLTVERFDYEGYRYNLPDFANALSRLAPPVAIQELKVTSRGDWAPIQFAHIRNKALQGLGCNQIKALIECGGNVEEPLWRAGLSVVMAGDDAEADKMAFLREISQGHPEFDMATTVEKANSTRAGYSCESFKALNPMGCAGCPYAGAISITNPAQTGAVASFSEKERAGRIEAQALAHQTLPQLGALHVVTNATQRAAYPEPSYVALNPEVLVTAPKLVDLDIDLMENASVGVDPEPEFPGTVLARVAHGGNLNTPRGSFFAAGSWKVYLPKPAEGEPASTAPVFTRRVEGTGRNEGVTHIYKVLDKDGNVTGWRADKISSLTVYLDRIQRSEAGAMADQIAVRVTSPHDAEVRMVMPVSSIADTGAEATKMLSNLGAIDHSKVRAYIAARLDVMRNYATSKLVQPRMGWSAQPDVNEFTVGEVTLTGHGKGYANPLPGDASSSRKISHASAQSAGTLDGWNAMLSQIYPAGNRNLDLHRLVALSGFANPLMGLKQDDFGGLLHSFGTTGCGKTVAMHTALAIYGNPAQWALSSTTRNALEVNMGDAHSLPIGIDEITKTIRDPEDLSALVISTTQGAGKDRMNKSSNSNRGNSAAWRTFITSTGNQSLRESTHTSKDNAETRDANSVRIIEIELSAQFARDASGWAPLDALKTTHGVVGRTWIDHLVTHRQEMTAAFAAEVVAMGQRVKSTNPERFWVNILAAITLGAKVSSKLGLHPFDVSAIDALADSVFRMQRDDTAERSDEFQPLETLSNFLRVNAANTLLVSADGKVQQLHEPMHKVAVRRNMQTGAIQVAIADFRDYLKTTDTGGNTSARVIKLLHTYGIESTRRSIAAGSFRSTQSVVRVLEFSNTNPRLRELFDELDAHPAAMAA